jgi:hypothetical protein
VKRLVGLVLGLYLLAALGGRLAEHMGVSRCDCPPECWCKQPGLSVFRWVFPYGHGRPLLFSRRAQ